MKETPAMPALDAADQEILLGLFSRWEQLAESVQSLPPVSPLVVRLLRLDRDSPRAVDEVSAIVESDPILTARILGLANSAVQPSAGRNISDVKAAILRLGLGEACDEIFARVFGLWLREQSRVPDDELLDTLWLESLVTGFTAREIALAVKDQAVDPSFAYAAGMLHDVGTLALCWTEPRAMGRLVAAGYAPGTEIHTRFLEAHARLGANLLQRWNAPAEFVAAARGHHERLERQPSAVMAVLHMADHLQEAVAGHPGWTTPRSARYPLGCDGPATEQVSAALSALGLGDRLQDIIDQVVSQGERITALSRAG